MRSTNQELENVLASINDGEPFECSFGELARIEKAFARIVQRRKRLVEPERELSLRLLDPLGILQWEVMYRDHVAEEYSRVSTFKPGTTALQINGRLSDIDHEQLAKGYGQCGGTLLLDGYSKTLSSAVQAAPQAYDDFLAMVARRLSTVENEEARLAIIVPDGELTFFTMVWLFRVATAHGGLERWLVGEQPEIEVDFDPGGHGDQQFRKCDLTRFVTNLGILDTCNKEEVKATERWISLLEWLSYRSRICNDKEAPEEAYLPLKGKPRPGAEEDFRAGLVDFFKRDPAKSLQEQTSKKKWSCVNEFISSCIHPLYREIRDICSIEAGDLLSIEGAYKDLAVRFASVPSLPVEYCIRACQSYRLNLIIFPLDYIRTKEGATDFEPSVLAFMTILSPLPKDFWRGPKGRPGVREWLASYFNLASFIAGEALTGEARTQAERWGEFKRTKLLAHSTLSSVNLIWNEAGKLSEYSKFALWNHREMLALNYGNEISDPTDRVVDPDYGAFAGWSMLEFFHMITRAGLLTGVERAKQKRKKYDHEKDVTTALNFIRSRYPAGVNPVSDETLALEEDMGFKIHQLGQDVQVSWLDYRAFAVCYYEVLWQAAYHGLLACAYDITKSGTNGRKPYLQVRFVNENTIAVINRIMKPDGSEKAQITQSADLDLFRRLSELFGGVIEVSAPELIKDEIALRLTVHDVSP